MAERACLESMYTRKGIAGSNPALSASYNANHIKSLKIIVFTGFLVLSVFDDWMEISACQHPPDRKKQATAVLASCY